MTARVAINGFGRVGRLCLRSMLERHKDHPSVCLRSTICNATIRYLPLGAVIAFRLETDGRGVRLAFALPERSK
jgi:hypothetical protein